MKSFEAQGRTVEEAISAGLAENGLDIGDVSVEIVEEGSKGLFGLFGSRQAKVKLTLKEDLDRSETRDVFKDSLKQNFSPETRKSAEKPEPQKKNDFSSSPKKPAQAPKNENKPKPVKVKTEADPQITASGADKTAPAAPIVPAPQAEPGTPEGIVQSFLQDVTRLMGVSVSVAVRTDEESNVRVSISGDSKGILIGHRGETLDALQYLTSLRLNRGRDEYIRVTLDSEGYRAKREEALVRLAHRLANRAQKTGRKVSVEPMNPYERRIVHSALQNHPGIATHSEGEEPNRHIVITLIKDDHEQS